MDTYNDSRKQTQLFGDMSTGLSPLAERMRPGTLDEFFGQEHLVGKDRLFRKLIEDDRVSSMILWGAPGTGKTSLARVIAEQTDAVFVSFSAVISGIKEVKQVVAEARKKLRYEGKKTILFIDEIHRFNKAQQDAFLPHVENGTIILIGATTENPSFSVISPLLSRCKVYPLNQLKPDEIRQIVERALSDTENGLGKETVLFEEQFLDTMIKYSQGDARAALNTLELAVYSSPPDNTGTRHLTLKTLNEILQRTTLLYDKSGDQHYDIISALHKSLRGSDPDASLYWLARMIEGGEDPLFIARRLVRAASEDVGLADPMALTIALAAKDAVHFLGLPEANLALAQATVYLSCAPKSNALYTAYSTVKQKIEETGSLPVPLHIRNPATSLMKGMGYGKNYMYPHNYENAYVKQQYLPDAITGQKFYNPTDRGFERMVKTYMEQRQESIHDKIKRILQTYKRVAIVGLSGNREKDSYTVAKYLISKGYEITPVNPTYETILGKKSYPELQDVPKPLEIVDVFRKPGDIMPVAEAAVAAGAKVFWMQLGITNDEAAAYLEQNGIEVIQDFCMARELKKISG